MSWSPGALILGRYRLLHQLGEDEFLPMYVAEVAEGTSVPPNVCVSVGERVLVKTLSTWLLFDQDSRALLWEEAKVLEWLEHPHVVGFLEAGEHEERPVLVQRYVSGCDLRVLLAALQEQGRRLPWSLVLELGICLMEALDYIHHATSPSGEPLGLVHRDVSPSNVLLGWNGEVCLADFGLVFHQQMNRATAGTSIKGKFAYMAPEVLAEKRVDARADLFSFGVMLWEALVGRRLFFSEDVEGIFEAITSVEIVSPHELAPEIPKSMSDLVLWLLVREREERCPSGSAWLERALKVRGEGQREGGLKTLPDWIAEVCPRTSHKTKAFPN